MEEIDKGKQDELGNALLVQKEQRQKTEMVLAAASQELSKLEQLNLSNENLIDELLLQAEVLCNDRGYSENSLTEKDYLDGSRLIELDEDEQDRIQIPYFDTIKTLDVSDSWEEYYTSVKEYAAVQGIDLSKDPYEQLLTESEKDCIGQRLRDDYMMKKAYCDKYDYIIAAFCGVVAGLIDSFFVGMPGESKLGNWTDKMADKYTMNLSKILWKSDNKERNRINELFQQKKITKDDRDKLLKKAGIPYNQNLHKEPDTIQSCIQYIEKKFAVNYDATSAKYIEENGVLKGMRAGNHHLMSMAHSPTIIGLFFSIIDQFTGKATFVDNGKLIRVTPVEKKNSIDQFELRGGNFATKLLCGVVNWLGHLSSDLVGSNTTRSKEGSRGSGLPAPFLEVMQLCNFSVKDTDGSRISISELSVKIFEKGYDARFAAACAIPVLINEFMIRLLWSLKSRFYHKKTWKESIPFGNHPELRRMLLVGHGTLCVVDAVDASVRSVDLLTFSLHLNTMAWGRLAISGIQEVRAIYKENIIDVNALEDDLENEWQRLYSQIC